MSLNYGVAPSTLSQGMGGTVPMVVELWRYPAGGGAPTKVDSKTPDAYGQVFLKDTGLGSVKQSGAYIHYAVQAVKGDYIVGQYDWSPFIRTGYVESQVTLAIDAARASYVDVQCAPVPGSYPSTSSIGVKPEGCGGCENMWRTLHQWISQPTVVGELHATTGMVSNFNYGQQSGTTINTMVAYSLDGWSVSGSLKYTNNLGWDVIWRDDFSGARLTLSQFNYEEDAYQNDCTNVIHEYKTYPYAYNGGALWGASAGHQHHLLCTPAMGAVAGEEGTRRLDD